MAAKYRNDSSVLLDNLPLPARRARRRTEGTIQSEILQALNAIRDVRAARNTVGRLQDRNGTWVTYGLGVGSPDIIAIYTHPRGVALAFGVEVKTDKGRTSADQLAWAEVMQRRGLPTFIARTAEEAVVQVERWIAWASGAL